MGYTSTYFDPEKRHVPKTLSEIEDFVTSMMGSAPTFIDDSFDYRTIDTEFRALTEGFGFVRGKVGEERYAELMQLAAQANALFAADPNDSNGKTEQGFRAG